MDTHLLVPRPRSSAKVKVKYQGHVSQRMGVSGTSQTHLVLTPIFSGSLLIFGTWTGALFVSCVKENSCVIYNCRSPCIVVFGVVICLIIYTFVIFVELTCSERDKVVTMAFRCMYVYSCVGVSRHLSRFV